VLVYAVLVSDNLCRLNDRNQASIWHQSGYVESSLDIMVKSLMLRNSESHALYREIMANFQINLSVHRAVLS
jgi:hypothetical protein